MTNEREPRKPVIMRAKRDKRETAYSRSEALNDIEEMMRCADVDTVAEVWGQLTGIPIEVRDGELYIENPIDEEE